MLVFHSVMIQLPMCSPNCKNLFCQPDQTKTFVLLHIWMMFLLMGKFSTTSIDLFASRHNCKCARFIYWHQTVTIDAFNASWSKEFGNAIWPFSLIPKVLEKCITENAKMILAGSTLVSSFLQLIDCRTVDDAQLNQNLFLSFNKNPHPL